MEPAGGPDDLLPCPTSRRLATALGIGCVPFAPGTVGSLAALVPVLLVPDVLWPWLPLAGAACATVACVMVSRHLPAKGLGGDPRWFVLDEVAGMWLTVVVLSSAAWPGVLLAFVLFRVFDIWKPPPVRRLEYVGGGFGIVLDDLGAAGYALLLLLLFRATAWPAL